MASDRREAVANRPSRNRHILGRSSIFSPEVIDDIHIKAELGRYRMRGFSLFKNIPTFDDLTFLPGTLTRFVIEGYREKCTTTTVIGPNAKRPLVLDIPVYVTGMSFGALSYGGQDRARPRRHHGRHRHMLRRGRHDPRRAPLLREVALPVHPVPLRLQPPPSEARGMRASSSSARAARWGSAAI